MMYKYRRPEKHRPGRNSGLNKILIIALAALFFSAGYYFGNNNEITIIYRNETRTTGIINYVPYLPANTSHSDIYLSSIIVPAIDDEGHSLITILTVQAMGGEGRVLANIDKMLFWTDTQNSIRTSSKVASKLTGIDLSKYDIVYTIETNATTIEGPSAGTALAVATFAALEKKKLNMSVSITGTIDQDGEIGQVSQILAKAKAAKDVGIRLLLVPQMQSQDIIYETRKYCEQIGPAQICNTENVPKTVNVSHEAGIEIKEVSNIQEALKYFFEE